MSTAPCPDPNEDNEALFKAVDNIFTSPNTFRDEDVIEMEVARFRARLEAGPTAADPFDAER